MLGSGPGAVRKEKTMLFFYFFDVFQLVFEKIFILLGFHCTGK